MKGPKALRLVLFPPADIDESDTGLRFTDILFGFVIFQLFLRLQHFGTLPWFIRWQLIAGTTLVLGSWIGFRQSLNRSSYRLKFFNLPLLRFVLDQTMVILYFRVAVLYPNTMNASVDPANLVHQTMLALLLIFALYAAWDVLGIWMAYATENREPKYPTIVDDQKSADRAKPSWVGTGITFAFLVLNVLFYYFTHERDVDARGAEIIFGVATAVLLLYRFMKEARTSLDL